MLKCLNFPSKLVKNFLQEISMFLFFLPKIISSDTPIESTKISLPSPKYSFKSVTIFVLSCYAFFIITFYVVYKKCFDPALKGRKKRNQPQAFSNPIPQSPDLQPKVSSP